MTWCGRVSDKLLDNKQYEKDVNKIIENLYENIKLY